MKKVHVVVIEDDKDIGFLMMYHLDQEEWIEAVHLTLAEAAMDPDQWTYSDGVVVGIIDLMLPNHTGIEVAKWVRENVSKDCPLMAITAAPEWTEIYQDAVDSGYFNSVNEKPMSPNNIINEIARLAGVDPNER